MIKRRPATRKFLAVILASALFMQSSVSSVASAAQTAPDEDLTAVADELQNADQEGAESGAEGSEEEAPEGEEQGAQESEEISYFDGTVSEDGTDPEDGTDSEDGTYFEDETEPEDEEAVNDAADEEILEDEVEEGPSVDITDKSNLLGRGGTPTLTGDYYVTGAAQAVDKNDLDNYVGSDGLYDDYLTGSQKGDQSLFTAFYNDMLYERQGGKWYNGHEVIHYGASSKKVYDPTNYAYVVDDDEATVPVDMGYDTPQSITADNMVFELNYLPVELSDQYVHSVNYGETVKLSDVRLYVWEYEVSGDKFVRIRTEEIPADSYDLFEDKGVTYTNSSFVPDATVTSTLEGTVTLNSNIVGSSDNYIAIVAMIYDATQGSGDVVRNLAKGTEQDIWNNDPVWYNLADYYGNTYTGSYNNYVDDMYSAANMGSFNLRAYSYYKDKSAGTVTLYRGLQYYSYGYQAATGKFGDYVDVRDIDTAADLIETWEIPAQYTDPYDKETYQVILANEPNYMFDDDESDGLNCGFLYPALAVNLIIDEGVTFPSDCSYFLNNNYWINCLSTFTIGGSPASVGSNITKLSHFMTYDLAHTDKKWSSIDVSALDTGNVTDMSYMFENVTIVGYSSANIDVSHFNTSNVKNFEGMFHNYRVTDMNVIRHYYSNVDVSRWDTSNAENMSYMFAGMWFNEGAGAGCGTLDVSGLDFTSKLKNMRAMFAYNIRLTGEGLVKIILPAAMDTSGVLDMSLMFQGDASLSEIVNLDKLNTSSVIDMSAMFGACFFEKLFHHSNSYYEILLTPIENAGNSGSWIYDRTNLNDSHYYMYDDDYPGPEIESLDLSGFDTRNVRYAYGMFCLMPALTEIKWGTNTTFENVTDATAMFVLPGIGELDLTGRKLTSIKYAHIMLALKEANELTLGADSLALSNIAADGRFSVSGPMAVVDFSNVDFGTNIHALDNNSLFNGDWTIYNPQEGLTKVEELRFPAGMPYFAKPAALRQTFFDRVGDSCDYVYGGNTEPLVLTTSASGYQLERLNILAMVGDSLVENINPESLAFGLEDTRESYLDDRDITYNFSLIAMPYEEGSGEFKELTPAPDIKWSISDPSVLEVVYNVGYTNTNDEILVLAKKTGTARVTVDVNGELSRSVDITVYGNKTDIVSSDGSTYTGVKLPDNTYMITGCKSVAAGDTLDLSADMTVGGSAVTISRIGKCAFAGSWSEELQNYPEFKERISTIKLPTSLEVIDYGAFMSLDKVTLVDIPTGSKLKNIGDYAFSNLGSSLYEEGKPLPVTVVSFENARELERIGSNVFFGAHYLNTVVLPENMTYLGANAFSECENLTEVTMPTGLTAIPSRLFEGAGGGYGGSEPTDLTITNLNEALARVTFIGEKAFHIPGGLDGISVEAPLLISLGDSAFAGTDIEGFSAPNLTVMGVTGYTGSDYGYAFSGCEKLATASIPSVKEVSCGTFSMCKSLTSVDISSAVVIGKNAFSATSSLTGIKLHEGITTIDDRAFYDSGLTSVELPDSLRTIGSYAFSGSKIEDFTVPDGVTKLGEGVCERCDNLTTVYIGKGITEIPAFAFSGTFDINTGWSNKNLKNIHIGNNVKRIGESAFEGVTFENGIKLPGSLECIDKDAFKDAYNGTVPGYGYPETENGVGSIEIPYGVTEIPAKIGGTETFRGKSSHSYIEELYLPYTIKDICGLMLSGLFRSSDEQFEYETADGSEDYRYKYEGTIYYPGTKQELLDVIFGENDSTYNANGDRFGPDNEYSILDLIDVEYGTGFREEGGKLVFYKKGVPVAADSGKELIEKIGAYYYLVDDGGGYVTDRTYIAAETADSVTTTYIYYFDSEGRGERKEVTAADILSGSRVYSFDNGRVHGAMEVDGVKPVTVAGASDIPSASPSTLTTIDSKKYFGKKNGVLAKGFVAGNKSDGFYFDDYKAGDGRLLWYADFGTKTYYTDETGSDLLGGEDGIVLKDERGVLVTFKNGKIISLTNDDLSITADPAFSSGTTMVLFTGEGASEDSDTSPSRGRFTVTVVAASKGADLTGAGIKWSIVSSFPMVAGTKVVTLSDATALSESRSEVTINAVSAGSAKIRATLTDSEGNSFYKEATVTVKDLDPVPTGIRLIASSTAPIHYDETVTLSTVLLPENTKFKDGFDKVTWSTSDTSGNHSFASITDNGDGTAVLTGKWSYWEGRPLTQKVTVIASTKNGKTARMIFTVTAEDKPDPGVKPSKVTITCEDPSKVVYVGKTYDLTAAVTPADAPQDVTWESSDTSVATVSGGRVTGIKSGEVTITAASAYDTSVKSSVKLTVRAKVSSITLNTYTQSIPAGKTFKLIATFNDGVDKADMGIKWVSSDATVATVDQNGVVTARSAASGDDNKVKITAISTADESVKSDPCVITVYDPITSLKFSAAKVSLGADGEEYQDLILQVLPYTASCEEVEFTSSDGDIVNSSVVETDNDFTNTIRLKLKAGSKSGKATITALAKNGKKAVCTVTVGRKVDSFIITAPKTPNDGSMLTLSVGKTMKLGTQFNGGIKSEQPANKTVVWTIDSGTDVDGVTEITDRDALDTMATIDPGKGTVKALRAGFVTVKATHAASGSSVYRQVRLFVPNTKLTLSDKKLTIKEGRSDYTVVSHVTDGATIFDGNAILPVQDKVTWEITKSDVDEDGKPLVKVNNIEDAACNLYIVTLPEGRTKATATLKATAVSDGNNGMTVTKTTTCTITVTKGVNASKVVLDKTKISAGVGSSFELAANVTPMSADNTELVFTSSDPSAVAVADNHDGTAIVEVTAVPANAKKQVVITATNPASGKKATCTVTVGGLASKVEITNKAISKGAADDKYMSLIVGKNTTMKANVTAADGSKAANTGVYWKITKAYNKDYTLIYDAEGDGTEASDDPAIAALIATVDAKGKVIAKSCGKVVVKATTKEITEVEGGIFEPAAEDTVDIVIYKPVTKLTLSASKRSIGETTDAGAQKIGSLWISKVTPDSAFYPSDPSRLIHWTSSAPDVIVIAADDTDPEFGADATTTSDQKLLFKAIAPSKKAVTITATATDNSNKSAKCTVKVLGAMKESDVGILITSKSAKALKNVITVYPGYDTAYKELTVTGLPVKKTLTLTSAVTATAADKKVVFTSSNTSVATVNAKGVVTAKGSGTAIITMVTEDGGFEATCTVTVP